MISSTRICGTRCCNCSRRPTIRCGAQRRSAAWARVVGWRARGTCGGRDQRRRRQVVVERFRRSSPLAHGRGLPAEPDGDLPYSQPAFAQCREAPALQQRQVTARILRNTLGRQASVLRPPSVAGLATSYAHQHTIMIKVLRRVLAPGPGTGSRFTRRRHRRGFAAQRTLPRVLTRR